MDSPSTTSFDATAVVQRFYEMSVNACRPDLLDELVDAAYVNHGPFPWSVRDRADLERFEIIRELAFPDLRVTIDEIVAAADVAAYRMTISGTDTGEFLGIPPTGRPVTVAAMGFARIANGRIAETWGLVDEFGILDQLGIHPESIAALARRRAGSTAPAAV